jgi:hypothetical protein
VLETAHLDTSFTTVSPTVLKQPSSKPINSDDFADEDIHFIVRDRVLANRLSEFAMASGFGISKVAVGSKETHTAVEFYSLDLKKNKKEVAKLFKLITVRWLEALQAAEMKRETEDGNLFSSALTEDVDTIVELASLRRYLLNAADPSVLSKKKRTVLLFHHRSDNAPRPD